MNIGHKKLFLTPPKVLRTTSGRGGEVHNKSRGTLETKVPPATSRYNTEKVKNDLWGPKHDPK